jgi:hypothetical protein
VPSALQAALARSPIAELAPDRPKIVPVAQLPAPADPRALKAEELFAQATPDQAQADPTDRFPLATALPISGINIDGRLDDWPQGLRKYEIGNQLVDHSAYDPNPRDPSAEPNPYFLAGYNPQAGLIYLAVVVHDDETVVHPTEIQGTDAVEVYIDGTCSDRRIAVPNSDWMATLDAATMPVLQYVGVPGAVSAYSDKWGANPSLVYAKSPENATQMRYRRAGNVTTYEWAVKAYDRFPDRPTRLLPGKKLGLDIAVVDKDRGTRFFESKRPTFTTWGSPPSVFKGCDAASLGVLVLAPAPP